MKIKDFTELFLALSEGNYCSLNTHYNKPTTVPWEMLLSVKIESFSGSVNELSKNLVDLGFWIIGDGEWVVERDQEEVQVLYGKNKIKAVRGYPIKKMLH